jgi:hypothetical protein
MTEEKCECGHLKSEHTMFKKFLLKDENRTTIQWVAPGQGLCLKCECSEYIERKPNSFSDSTVFFKS